MSAPLGWLPPPISSRATYCGVTTLWGREAKGGKYTFNFFLPRFLFTLDLQQATATAPLQTEAAIHSSWAKKGSFVLC